MKHNHASSATSITINIVIIVSLLFSGNAPQTVRANNGDQVSEKIISDLDSVRISELEKPVQNDAPKKNNIDSEIIEIQFSSEFFISGETTTIFVTVCNNSLVKWSANSEIHLKFSVTSNQNIDYLYSRIAHEILPGERATIKFDWFVPYIYEEKIGISVDYVYIDDQSEEKHATAQSYLALFSKGTPKANVKITSREESFGDESLLMSGADVLVSHWADPFYSGHESQLGIYWENVGDTNADNVIITSQIPGAITYIDSWGGSYSPDYQNFISTPLVANNTLIWELGTVEPGWYGWIYISVRLSASALIGSSIETHATISTTSADFEPINDTSVYQSNVNPPSPDLSLSYISLYRDVYPNQLVTMSARINTAGVASAESVKLTGVLSDGLLIEDLSGTKVANGEYLDLPAPVLNGNQIIWDLGTMDPGNYAWIYIDAYVPSNFLPGNIIDVQFGINQVAGEVNYSNNTLSRQFTVSEPAPDLVTNIWVQDGTFFPGNEITYEVYWANDGSLPAENAALTYILPNGLTFQSVTGYSYSPTYQDVIPQVNSNGNILSWDIGTIEPDWYGYYLVTVQIDPATIPGTVFTNDISITEAPNESILYNNHYSQINNCLALLPDLQVQILNEEYFLAGQETTFRINWSNVGGLPATSVILSATLPDHLEYVGFNGESYAPNFSPFTISPIIDGDTISWEIGTVEPGWYGNLWITVRVSEAANAGEVIQLHGAISPAIDETSLDNNTADKRVSLQLVETDLSIRSWLRSGQPYPGGEVELAIFWENQGTLPANEVNISLIFPDWLNYLDSGIRPCIYGCAEVMASPVVAGNEVSWNMGNQNSLSAGFVFVRLMVSQDALAEEQILSNISISSQPVDGDLSDNNSQHELVIMTPSADLNLNMYMDWRSLFSGNEVPYELTWKNEGSLIANTAALVFTLPSDLTYVRSSNQICDPDCRTLSIEPTMVGSQLSWNLGDVALGVSGSTIITVAVGAEVLEGEAFTATAGISTQSPEIDYSDNTGSHTAKTRRFIPDIQTYKWNPDALYPGYVATYSLYWSNDGMTTVDNFIVMDTLPEGLTYVSSSIYGYTPDYVEFAITPTLEGNSVNWDLGTIEPNWYGYIYLTVHVSDSILPGTEIKNRVEVPVLSGEINLYNNARVVKAIVQPLVPDLNIYQYGWYMDRAYPGDEVVLVLNWANYGVITAENVILTDTLPEGLTFVSSGGYTCNPNCASTLPEHTLNGNIIEWDLGTVEPGWGGRIELIVQIDPSAVPDSDLSNQASLTIVSGEINTANNTSHYVVTVLSPAPDMFANKWSWSRFYPGENASYRLYWANQGSAVASDVVLVDTLPDGVSYVNFSGFMYTPGYMEFLTAPTVTGNTLTWNLGDIQPDWNGYIDVEVLVSDTTTPGSVLVNELSIGAVDGEVNTDNNVDTYSEDVLTPVPDMWVSKSSSSTFYPGHEVTYTIYWSNQGQETASNVVINDTLPSELTYISSYMAFSTIILPEPSIDGNQISWQLGDIAPGWYGWIYLTARLDSNAVVATTVTNQVSLPTVTGEINSENNISSCNNTISQLAPDMTISKWSYSNIYPGLQATYYLDWRNTGVATAENVTVIDELPANTTYISSSVYGYTPDYTTLDVSPTIEGNRLTFAIGNVDAGWSGQIVLTVLVDSATEIGAQIINEAYVPTVPGEERIDNNHVSHTMVVQQPFAQLFISKQFDNGKFYPGEELTYQLYWENSGQIPAENVVVTDVLPAELSFISASGTMYAPEYQEFEIAPTIDGNQINWNLGTIESGWQGWITLKASIGADVEPGIELNNQAVITSDTAESITEDNLDFHTGVVLTPAPDMSLSSYSGGNLYPGETIYFYLSWRNEGNQTAENVILVDSLPASLSFVSSSGYSYSPNYSNTPSPVIEGNSIQWNLGNIEPDWYGTIWLQVRVNSTATPGDNINHQPQITPVVGEVDLQDNVISSSYSVAQPYPDIALSKQVNSGQFAPENEVTYQISWANYGQGLGEDLLINDYLPAELNFLEAWGYRYSPYFSVEQVQPVLLGNTLSWHMGEVKPGTSGELYVKALVSEQAVQGAEISNNVEATVTSQELNTSNNTASTLNVILPSTPDLSISKSLSTNLFPGYEATYQIYWSNSGTGAAENVQIMDYLPDGLTYLNYSSQTYPSEMIDPVTAPIIDGNVITWNLGTVEHDWYGYIDVTVQVQDTLGADLALSNSAEILTSSIDNNLENNYVTGSHLTKLPSADLSVSKSLIGSLAANSEIIYRLNYTNNTGGNPAEDVSILDTVPLGMEFRRASWWLANDSTRATAITPAIDGNLLQFSLGDVPVWGADGYYGSIYVTLYAPATIFPPGLPVTNQVNLTSANDSNLNNNTASVTNSVVSPTRDLYVSTGLYRNDAVIGHEYQYSLYYRNYGNASADNVVLMDTLPLHTTFVSAVTSAGTTATPDHIVVNENNQQVLTWNLGTIPGSTGPGYVGTIYITVLLDSATPVGTELINTGSISTTQEETPNTRVNISVSTLDAIEPIHTLVVNKEVSGAEDNFLPGTKVWWQIYASNEGNVSEEAVITDTLPASITIDPESTDCEEYGWTCTISENTITWTNPDFTPYAYGYFSIVGNLPEDAVPGTEFTNTVNITSPAFVEPPATAESAVIVSGADLNFSLASLDFQTQHVGYPGQLTLTLSNIGFLPLTVSSIYSDSAWITVTPTNIEILPGEQRIVQVTISPYQEGPFSAILYFVSNDYLAPIIELPISANVVAFPSITIHPQQIEAEVIAGDATTASINVSNFGMDELTFTFHSTNQTIESVLDNLNSNYQAVLNVIPNKYNFEEGETGSQIVDGGQDMYDGGNIIGTNLANNISYSNNAILTSPAFGETGRYFTRKFPGLFVMAAEIDTIESFQLSGNLGADSGGNVEADILQTQINGIPYLGYVKRTFPAGKPSINHLVIVRSDPQIDTIISTNSGLDGQVVSGLSASTRIYYLLFAGNNGAYIGHEQSLTIMEAFLTAVDDSSDWLQAPAGTNTLQPQASMDYSVTLDGSNLVDGLWSSELVLVTNDPAKPQLSIPVQFHVGGTPAISTNPDALAFGQVFVGTTVIKDLMISNTGSAPLSVVAINSSTGVVSVDFDPLLVQPGESRVISVSFQPVAVGILDAYLTIDSNAGSVNIPINGESLLPPVIQVTPTTLEVGLNAGEDVNRSVTISNVGNNSLDYETKVNSGENQTDLNVAVLGSDSSISHQNDIISTLSSFGTIDEVSFINTSTDLPTLIQLKGYAALLVYDVDTYRDELGNLLADYVDSGGGVVMMHTALTATNSVKGRFLSGGYYGIDVTNSDSDSDRYLTISSPINPAHPLLDAVGVFSAGYYSYHSTAKLTAGAEVIARYSNGDPLVVEKNFRIGERLVNRVDLNFIPYSSISSWGSWNALTDGGRLMVNALLYVTEPRFITWIPQSGSIQAGNDQIVDISVDGSNLFAGIYNNHLQVTSNDPITPLVSIPITTIVHGLPQISTSLTEITFADTFVGYSKNLELMIFNPGSATLDISSILSSSEDYLIINPPSLVPPHSQRTVGITFAPGSSGLSEGVISILSSSTNTPQLFISVSGSGMEVPTVGTDQNALVLNQDTGLVNTYPLKVFNTGQGVLNYSLSTQRGYVTLAPANGSIVGPGEQDILITLDTRSRQPGPYSDQIILTSNDPERPSVTIPVAINVILAMPETPVNPNPSDGEVNYSFDGNLTWEASTHATSYDIYLWKEGEAKPEIPTASNLTSATYNPPVNFAEETIYHWQVIARNLVGSSSSSEWTFTTEAVSDLIVSSVTAPTTAYSSSTIEIGWNVQNTGTSGTTVTTWYDYVYLSQSSTFSYELATRIGQVANQSYLGSGESYASSGTFSLPQGISGDYYFYVIADGPNSMREKSEDNNDQRSPATTSITLLPPPDLQVTQVTGPGLAFSGDNVAVSWTVKNNGLGSTITTQWSDAIYLSTNATFEWVEDDLLETVPHTGVLDPSSTYMVERSIQLPEAIYGDFYLLVMTDRWDAVYENVWEENNLKASAVIHITLTPPPDLVVSNVVVPAEGQAGEPMIVSWDVTNNGAGETFESNWLDRIYLSSQATFDAVTATVLGTVINPSILAPGASYSNELEFTLPDRISGTYYVHVRTDYANQVFEFDQDNNNVLTSAPLTVSHPVHADLSVSSVSYVTEAAAGAPMTVAWRVENHGESSTVDSWTDQVYLLPTNYWTPGGLLLGSFIHQNGLEADSAYQVSRTIVLPEGLEEGIYVIHVFTDANAQVFEHQDEDNNTALGDYIWVDIAEEYLPSDLIVSEFGTPSAVVSGETYELSWTVNNDGPAVTRATAWTDGIYLSTDSILNTESDLLLTTLVHLGSLAKDSSYTQTTQVVIPNGIDGQYILFLSTDIFSKVIDSDRTNNQMAKATAIDLADAVDLTPGITSLPDQGVSGQSVDIAWQVTNLGIGSANGSWHDAVYLSTDSNLDASDHQVVSKIAYGPLGSNVSYPRSATFSLPSTISGNYYILVETDSSDQVYEHGAETNNLVSQAITILTPPPSDLIVSAISLPATAVPGASVNINWTIQNQGENTASGRLCDSVFISADMQWNLSDPKVGTLCYQINLPIGGSTQNLALFDLPASDVLADLTAALAASISETMPGITPGTYYAIVRTDVYNQIKESNDANNTSASLDMVAVDVQALALGVPVADTYAQNQGRYYKIEVPAGETLRISLDSQSTSATNELYVRFGEIPSRLNFDFMYSAPMEPDQEILVPATQEGAYYIFTLGASPVDNTQQISITADLVTFSLKAVTPAEVGRKGLVTLSITGAKFHPEAQVWLDNGVASFGSVLTHWVDSTTMYATFNLSQAPISPYDLSMYSDGSIMTLSEAVNLIDGIPGEVQISYNAPSNLRPGQNGVLTINYFNPGNTDVWGVNARILSENAAMRFPEELEFTSTEVVIPMVSQSGPPIMLMPGESQQATLFFHPTTENGDVKFKVWLETTESSFQASLPDGSEFTVPTADNLSVQLNDHPENSGKVVQSDSPISLLSSINGLPKEYITNNTFADVGKIQDLLMARESPLADYRYSHLGNELTAADIVYMASITADWEINPEILLVYLQMYYNLLDPISLTSAEIDQLVTFSIDAGQSLLDQLTWLAGILWSSADVNSEGMVTFANPQEPGGLELAETQGDFKAKYEGVFERSGPIELMATPIDWKPAFLKPMGGTLQINSFFDHSSLSNDNNISRFDDNVLPAKYGQTYGWYDGHRANDLVVIGNSSADVLAVKDGTVVYASTSESCTMEIDGKLVTRYGTTVKITHANGLRTSYRHLNSIGTNPRTSKVWTDKDEIYAGEIVGVEGTTGCSTGYHLDFRVDGGTSFATSYDVFGWWGAGADHYNQPLFSSGLVIDEQSGQGFQNFYWDNQWKRENIGEGGKSLSVLSSTIQEDPKKWAIWWATIPKVGKYEVFAFIPTGAQAKAVQYRVLYQDGKFSNLTIDQSANQNKWVSLGQYDFTVGGPAAVKLTEYSNGENGKKVFFDSIKWVEVVPESQPIPPGDTFWQEILVRIVRSMDPNDILGPEGYGEARWVAHDQILGYTIRYENDESQATAPAQRVVIEQVLAEQLDLRSFRLGAFGFHGLIYEVPANRSYYQNRLGPVDINGESLFVDLYAGIDIVSGEAFWIFQAIDPVTGEPPEDPLIGFLPPDIIEGEGQGFVSYSVKPKTNAQTGDVVNAMASIVFDQNDPIDTPVIFNTIDAVPPTSIMGAISPTTIGDQVLLTWETSDDAGGSGVAGVDLYLSVDDQPFELEIAAITESAFVYSGEVGHKYAFFTRATDFAGNREMIKDAPEVTTFMYIPDQAGVIELVATPSVLIANGIDSTTVRIVVKDGSGKVLPDQMVALITTDGTLSTQTVITDINGTANVVLTAPTNAIDIVLTATAGQSSEQLEINVVDEPTVSLEATSDAPTMLGQPTNFTAEVTGGTNVLVYWEFGDGLSDTGTNVTHVYETAGPYTVKVWAINDANELFYEINIVIDSPIEEPDNFIYLPVVIKN